MTQSLAVFYLEVTGGDAKGQNCSLKTEPITVGRQENCDLVLPNDSLASRKHALFGLNGSAAWVENLSSLNGVFVNQTKITQRQVLNPGDEIIVGNHLMVLRLGQPSSLPAGSLPQGGLPSAHPTQAPEPQTNLQNKISSHDALRRLYLFYQLNRATASQNPTDNLLRMILSFIFQDLRVSRGCIYLFNREANQFQPVSFKIRGQDDSQALFSPPQDFINMGIKEMRPLYYPAKDLGPWQLTGLFIIPLIDSSKPIGIIYLDSNHAGFSAAKSDLEFLEAMAHLASACLTKSILENDLERHKQIISRLEKHVGSEVAQIVRQYKVELDQSDFQTDEREVSILFSDIVGFTSMSERLKASEIAFLLNGYFNHMADCVAKHHGYLNKYIGDAVMAVFGAPQETGHDAHNAIACAQEMLQRLRAFWKTIDESKRFKIRIGINTGTVVAGNIGSLSRMEYTVIGDAVNLASRLESRSEPNSILVGEKTYETVKNDIKAQELGSIEVKGKKQAVRVYKIL